MSKIYQNELAAGLAEKCGIESKKAQLFVASVVKAVQSGLGKDRLVKIRGLGTFKVVDVDARESVNVNTGERLVIEGHSKLSFLPDTTMKELVNRPFSQFETVVLNDGVDFSDFETPEQVATSQPTEESSQLVERIEALPKKVSVKEEESLLVEEKTTIEKEVVVEKPVIEEKPVFEEEPTIEEEPVAEDEVEEETVTMVEEEPMELELFEEPAAKSNSWRKYLVTSVLALIIGFTAGYLAGKQTASTQVHNVALQKKEPAPAVPQQAAPQQTAAVSAELPTQEGKSPAEIQPEQPACEDEASGEEPIWEKYNKMDRRTHDGFYYIMGLDHVDTAREGDTPGRIAKRVFGASEMACYIEVFNGFAPETTVLEAGTEVKIPKVEPKKTVRKRLKQQQNNQ